MSVLSQLDEAVAVIRRLAPQVAPRVGVVLGSGLGAFADSLERKVVIPYPELPHFVASRVAGHAGRLVLGELRGVPLAVMQGRVHQYEGHSAQQVVLPVRVLCKLGIRALLLTNAAGTVNPAFRPGDLMAITDHLNLSGSNPLTGPNEDDLGPRFPDLSQAYHPALRRLLDEAAKAAGVTLRQGVYAMLAGPSYETPAEIRMLRVLGADAVGMSTVPEVIAATHQGVRTAAVSCITNLAAGVGDKPLSHEEVAETAQRVMEPFCRLLTEFVVRA